MSSSCTKPRNKDMPWEVYFFNTPLAISSDSVRFTGKCQLWEWHIPNLRQLPIEDLQRMELVNNNSFATMSALVKTAGYLSLFCVLLNQILLFLLRQTFLGNSRRWVWKVPCCPHERTKGWVWLAECVRREGSITAVNILGQKSPQSQLSVPIRWTLFTYHPDVYFKGCSKH